MKQTRGRRKRMKEKMIKMTMKKKRRMMIR